jgi:hypothetical protein
MARVEEREANVSEKPASLRATGKLTDGTTVTFNVTDPAEIEALRSGRKGYISAGYHFKTTPSEEELSALAVRVERATNVNWQPITLLPANARNGRELLLGFAGSADMDFYRWHSNLAESNQDPEIYCWADRCSNPPHQRPSHFMLIEPPSAP